MVVLLSCTASRDTASYFGGHTYNYSYKLISPSQSEKLIYEDSALRFKFHINSTGIITIITNKLLTPATINWEGALITQYRQKLKVVHKDISYEKRNEPKPPTVIAAAGHIEDMIVPVDNIGINEGGYFGAAAWTAKALYPIEDHNKSSIAQRILSNVGQELVLTLPIKSTGKEFPYEFRFKIVAIDCIDCAQSTTDPAASSTTEKFAY